MTKGNDKESWKPECRKLLEEMIHDRETQPFRAPVPYEEYGLFDYPTIVKHPMDLGTIKQKFNEYTSPKMFQADVYLVWDNCMLYNQEGSDYYKLAERLKKKFKDKYAKIRNPHKAKAPKDDEKARFSQNIFCLESDQLGHVVRILDDKCDKCIDKTDPEEIEIDVDKIDPLTFRALENYIKQCKEENQKKKEPKRSSSQEQATDMKVETGASAPSQSAAIEPANDKTDQQPAKKART